MRYFLKAFGLTFSLLKKLCYLAVAVLLLTFAIEMTQSHNEFPTLSKIDNAVIKLTQPAIEPIKEHVPYRFYGIDYSILMLAAAFLVIGILCSLLSRGIHLLYMRIRERQEYYKWRKEMTSRVPSKNIAELDTKFAALNATNKSDRKTLLKEFAHLKNKLDKMRQNLAFLAIDVVDSTGIKRDEDKLVVSYTFDRYNQIAVECLKENGLIKYAMTPDGIMSCFHSVDNAVQAALCLISRLKDFNKNEKQIKGDIQVRCGINSGYVYIDDDTPLEQISDRVIDIAGHMQKYAKPNGINIAGSSIEPLIKRDGFTATTNVVDEQIIYEWLDKP